MGVTSLIILGLGVFMLKAGEFESNVTITQMTATNSGALSNQIWADIEGAVVRPGVYKMDDGARIDDLIRMAGGLSQTAERPWVDKNINRAQLIEDGYKLYIPSVNEANTRSNVNELQPTVISINSSSQSELESLPGIGPVTAQKIIAGRPYGRLEELKEKKIVGAKVWEGIKDLVSLW